MSEAAVVPPAAPAPPASAGATLHSVPAGPDWASGFKDDVKSYISQKGFKTPEALAESYKHLEAKFSSPPERTIVIPEKLEGDGARAIFERLGAPKEAKGYELPRDQGGDAKFVDWLEGSFAKHAVPKNQALGIFQAFKDLAAEQKTNHALAIKQADDALKTEWGAKYDQNLNIAKQGAKVLGLSQKTLDMIEAGEGRQALFKTLQKIGVSVGESTFVDGGHSPAATETLTPTQANEKIQSLMKDQKFQKKFNRGDADAIAEWTKLNQLAAPGEIAIR